MTVPAYLAAVAAAAVAAAGMTFSVMTVVRTVDIGIEAEVSCQEVHNSPVRIAGAAAVKPDASLCQRHLGATADTAADQNICVQTSKQIGQSTVATAVGVNDLGSNDIAAAHFVNLELLGVTEMLEDLTVSISNRNCHKRLYSFLIIPLL